MLLSGASGASSMMLCHFDDVGEYHVPSTAAADNKLGVNERALSGNCEILTYGQDRGSATDKLTNSCLTTQGGGGACNLMGSVYLSERFDDLHTS